MEFHGNTEMGIFRGRRPISWKMSRLWNRELGWSLVICLSFINFRSNGPISLKLGVMTEPTSLKKNWLMFGGDLVPDTDSGSLSIGYTPWQRFVLSVKLELVLAWMSSIAFGNGSAETTVAEGGRNPVAGLWGRTLGESWPPEPTSSYASIDIWCQLVASPATVASWMSVVAMVGWVYQAGLANCHVWRFSPPACQWQPSFVGLAVQCWRALETMGEV